MCTNIINIVIIDNINGIQEYLCPIYCELWVGHENSRQESLISYRLTFSETRDTWSHPACDNCDMIYVCVNTNWTELWSVCWRKSMANWLWDQRHHRQTQPHIKNKDYLPNSRQVMSWNICLALRRERADV